MAQLSWKKMGQAGLLAVIVAGLLAIGRPVFEVPASAQAPAARQASAGAIPSIEDMLATALKFNPEIRIAEAKLRDDEAELNRSRLLIMQKVIILHHTLQANRAAVEGAETKVQRLGELVRKGANQPAVLQEAQQELARARAKLDETRAELPYLLGQVSTRLSTEVIRTESQIGARRAPKRSLPAAVAAKIHQALDTPIAVDYQDRSLDEVLKDLQAKVPGVAFQRNLVLTDLLPAKITLKLGQVPLGAALLALGDTIPGLRVIVRDYGILMTWEHQIPLEGIRLVDFWKPAGQPAAARK